MSPLLLALLFAPQMQMDHGHMGQQTPATLRKGLGQVHHPVTTSNPLAQKFFDQGLALTYGFNHHASIESFAEAARLDPRMAMAHWGIAYAMGPNINMPIDPDTNRMAAAEVKKAQALESYASPEEVSLIEALANRYSDSDKPDFDALNKNYSTSMRAVAKKYPKDLDAQCLYAESLMDLHPWRLFTADGKPGPDTDEIISTLQGVLAKNPNHIGANHFLIHAVEASPYPELGRAAAKRLNKLAPESGHLVHMPSHIYLRLGDWAQGMKANEAAIKVDAAFLEKNPNPGVYPMYYVHNFDMYRACADMAGCSKAALWGADNVASKAAGMGPMGEPMAIVPMLERVRFAKWADIVALPAPTSADPLVMAIFHYSRGMAYAASKDVENASKEADAFATSRAAVGDMPWGLGTASQILDVDASLLDARIARAQNNTGLELAKLNEAVAAYDKIGYNEPADFYYPVRETLGGALLRASRYPEAVSVFTAELKLHPNNGRALFGLMNALKVDGSLDAIEAASRQFKQAWKSADTLLRVDDL